MKSFSEIDTVVKRATKGVGFNWGVAEEVGKNIKLLEMFGLPGLKNLNDYFNSLKSKKFQNLTFISNHNQSKIPYCPIISGISFLDQVNELKELINIKIENMSYPILFLPFLSRASEVIGKKISFKFDENIFLFNFNQNIYSNYFSNKILENAKLTEINFIENNNTFSQEEWDNLYKLSTNTFVEESDELKKSAAGAGLTDND
ncbi:DUF3726 domain-containing protein [Pelagibacterales bacterium SAG-MED15]|nr:DUF3726 domain-containing protein [Pelagibacterales bacterium SAG-MED15]|tara:strand:- start:1345 stop:1953 length:609 start_codon:yes stop_codon:yes gene_type:complete